MTPDQMKGFPDVPQMEAQIKELKTLCLETSKGISCYGIRSDEPYCINCRGTLISGTCDRKEREMYIHLRKAGEAS